MKIENKINSFYQKHALFFTFIVVIATILGSPYQIFKDFYIAIFSPKVLLFEELDNFSLSNGAMDFNNNFGMEKSFFLVNTSNSNAKLPENELILSLYSNEKLYLFNQYIISKWIIKNCSNIPITNDMFHKKIQLSGKNAKILGITLDTNKNYKVEHNHDSAIIDNVLINPHEKIDITVVYSPLNNQKDSSIIWDCHIENYKKEIDSLSKSIFLSPRISLQTNQIVKLVALAFILCLFHSHVLDKKGYFMYDFSIIKKIIWGLCVLCHFAFAECIAYLNWNYIIDSPEGYNWPWISITFILEIISFVYALRFHSNKSIKQNDNNPLNLTKFICDYCQQEHSVIEIQKHLKINSQEGFIEKVLHPLQSQGLIECVQVSSKRTTYRLTAEGLAFLQEQNHD